ncbi:TetR/AcrR family transcriptional regulator [Amycolatopsis sp. FDAARGOS 1241]|uniref:TetR/AcrR family transcriptional regulator n=1 Tax=Amycolatopsis sp. FDAARGOS 1241 TaxID=2778070 RepID=UPI001951910B|nr:TetR family transcriptional regulator [Amycolatopsis sp. FDAARGOS 1241]QRP44889.1 TetR family transcriptional regulator [Amycolatopsis sp. FDAARGOS 1241]
MSTGFQRARRPEQVEARRATILATATAMLRERPVAAISLRELSDRVGLAKSNVLRYFDSREAIFLEVLDEVWRDWLSVVADALVPAQGGSGFAREERVAATIARTLQGDRVLCELISSMGAVLERNISVESARRFKQRAVVNTDRLAKLVRECVPELSPGGAAHFSGAVFVLVAGLWPFATPTDAVEVVRAEMGAAPAADFFAENLTEVLTNLLAGLVARRR